MPEEKNQEQAPVECPLNPRWTARMLAVLPPGSRGKLAPYADCPQVKAELEKLKAELAGGE